MCATFPAPRSAVKAFQALPLMESGAADRFQLTDAEIADFKAKVQAAANNYNQALDVYKDLFKDLEIDDDSEDSLTGAVKGVTEETADIIAGQMNAIRINQPKFKPSNCYIGLVENNYQPAQYNPTRPIKNLLSIYYF